MNSAHGQLNRIYNTIQLRDIILQEIQHGGKGQLFPSFSAGASFSDYSPAAVPSCKSDMFSWSMMPTRIYIMFSSGGVSWHEVAYKTFIIFYSRALLRLSFAVLSDASSLCQQAFRLLRMFSQTWSLGGVKDEFPLGPLMLKMYPLTVLLGGLF